MKGDDNIIETLRRMEGIEVSAELPSPELMKAMAKKVLTRPLTPVRALPSDGLLILLILGCFVVFCVLGGGVLGMNGYHHLSVYQRVAYYAVIVLSAVTLSAGLVLELIPGSLRTMQPGLLLAIPIAATALVAMEIFSRGDFENFLSIGYRCLIVGSICAVITGAIGDRLLRSGSSSVPERAAATGGLLAGLAGFGVLALHCPVLSYAHILVWHGGAVALAALSGFALARWRR